MIGLSRTGEPSSNISDRDGEAGVFMLLEGLSRSGICLNGVGRDRKFWVFLIIEGFKKEAFFRLKAES